MGSQVECTIACFNDFEEIRGFSYLDRTAVQKCLHRYPTLYFVFPSIQGLMRTQIEDSLRDMALNEAQEQTV